MEIAIKIHRALYRRYLNYLFPSTERGLLKVSATSDLGKHIISRIRYANRPPEILSGSDIIRLDIPILRATANADKAFLYFTAEDQAKINLDLTATFNMDFDRYYLNGLKLSLEKKEIIESFILSRDLFQFSDDIDTIKKRVYRDELANLEKLKKQLVSIAHYRNSIIDPTLKTLKYSNSVR